LLRSIFISYRRSDSEGETGRLSDVLMHRFTDQAVFMDVDAIQPGRDFRKAIEESIQSCAVLLVVIGPDWLDAREPSGRRRLENPNDFVLLEIAAALRRDIPVIPVLVRGARMPHADELPAQISELAYRNGVELSHARWKSDLEILLKALEPHTGHGHAFMPRHAEPVHHALTETAGAGQAQGAPLVAAQVPLSQAPVVHEAVGSLAVVVEPVPAKVSALASLSPVTLEKVSAQLAEYIGPIAEVVVKRAAKKQTTLAGLYQAVAQEIESPGERLRFLAHELH
jgi:hypothetical protein